MVKQIKYSEPTNEELLKALRLGLKIMALGKERTNERWCGNTSPVDNEIARLGDELSKIQKIEVSEG